MCHPPPRTSVIRSQRQRVVVIFQQSIQIRATADIRVGVKLFSPRSGPSSHRCINPFTGPAYACRHFRPHHAREQIHIEIVLLPLW